MSCGSQAGKCDLAVAWYAFPFVTERAGLPQGSAGAQCGANGKDLGGTFKIKGASVIVTVPMTDMAGLGVKRGATMTKLRARTAPLDGLNGDDTSAVGDAASSPKPWVIGS